MGGLSIELIPDPLVPPNRVVGNRQPHVGSSSSLVLLGTNAELRLCVSKIAHIIREDGLQLNKQRLHFEHWRSLSPTVCGPSCFFCLGLGGCLTCDGMTVVRALGAVYLSVADYVNHQVILL